MTFFRLWFVAQFELPSFKVIGISFFSHDYSFNNLTLLRVSVQKKV